MSNKTDQVLVSVEELLGKNKLVDRHSFFQLKNFVIGKELSATAKMWQIIRELKARKENIEAIQLQIEEVKDSLEENDIRMHDLEDQMNNFGAITNKDVQYKLGTIQKRRFDRQKKSLQKSLANLEAKLVYTMEETEYLVSAFAAINKNHEFKSFDDTQAQKEYWNDKISTEINLKSLLGQAMDLELLKTTLSLDDDMPIKQKTIQYLQGVQKQMQTPLKGSTAIKEGN